MWLKIQALRQIQWYTIRHMFDSLYIHNYIAWKLFWFSCNFSFSWVDDTIFLDRYFFVLFVFGKKQIRMKCDEFKIKNMKQEMVGIKIISESWNGHQNRMERTESLSAIMMVKSGLGSTLKRIQVLLHTIDTDLFFFCRSTTNSSANCEYFSDI